MTVSELRQILESYTPDAPVLFEGTEWTFEVMTATELLMLNRVSRRQVRAVLLAPDPAGDEWQEAP